ncbi:C-X-C motif chemokine 5-like [Labrus mixtus]|uniref:C-X-C motif chemokine 5-like n=1 Tax=Labrus mixtus TaxID=508554 RepID=UPI0029C04C07|nr:C-X-C motif chemokine 5-like [Labrus mixtus]
MSSILKVFLLLAVMVCVCKAQLSDSGQQCLCRQVRKGIKNPSDVKDIQIYPVTVFCDKVEIVVSTNHGLRYCLNPQLNAVKRLLAKIMAKQNIASPGSTL